MGDYRRDSEKDKFRDCWNPEIDDYTDEELLEEFEAVQRMDVLPIPAPPPDEFEKIWARIQEERAESRDSSESREPEHHKIIRPRFRWKRLAVIGLVACFVAGSGCMVAMGTKSYFYRGRERSEIDNGIVFNNDSNKIAVNGEEEAYIVIGDQLNIRPLKLGYIPSDMTFLELDIDNGIAYMRFFYNDENIFFIQSKYTKEVSYDFDSDSQNKQTVYNKWLRKNLDVYEETLSDGRLRYGTSIVIDGIYYSLSGVIEKDEFLQITERLIY